ncbi:MAG: Fe-S cluster assembly sulfur transfer protein SufU [Bacteroidota bacterium]
MEELRELYQQVILDHNKAPRNFGKLEEATHKAAGDNPLCGDHVDLYVNVEDGVIKNIMFEGKGCAISKASASLMTEELKGKTVEEAREIFQKFHEMVTDEAVVPDMDEMGKLVALAGVREFPIRVKCASLAWHTFNEAMEQTNRIAKTE